MDWGYEEPTAWKSLVEEPARRYGRVLEPIETDEVDESADRGRVAERFRDLVNDDSLDVRFELENCNYSFVVGDVGDDIVCLKCPDLKDDVERGLSGETKDRYDVMVEFLRYFGVSERDVDWVVDHADPVGLLLKQSSSLISLDDEDMSEVEEELAHAVRESCR